MDGTKKEGDEEVKIDIHDVHDSNLEELLQASTPETEDVMSVQSSGELSDRGAANTGAKYVHDNEGDNERKEEGMDPVERDGDFASSHSNNRGNKTKGNVFHNTHSELVDDKESNLSEDSNNKDCKKSVKVAPDNVNSCDDHLMESRKDDAVHNESLQHVKQNDGQKMINEDETDCGAEEERHDANGLTVGIGEVMKVGLGLINTGDNPGHVFHGNDDDDDNDGSNDNNSSFTPLKSIIPPVRLLSIEGQENTTDMVTRDHESKNISSGSSAEENTLSQAITAEDDTICHMNENNEDLETLTERRMTDKSDVDCEGKYQTKRDDEKIKEEFENGINTISADDDFYDSRKQTEPMPPSQALTYRRNIRCPERDQEDRSDETIGHCNVEIFTREGGEIEHSVSSALLAAVSVVNVGLFDYEKDLDKQVLMEDVNEQKSPPNSKYRRAKPPITIDADVSVHASQSFPEKTHDPSGKETDTITPYKGSEDHDASDTRTVSGQYTSIYYRKEHFDSEELKSDGNQTCSSKTKSVLVDREENLLESKITFSALDTTYHYVDEQSIDERKLTDRKLSVPRGIASDVDSVDDKLSRRGSAQDWLVEWAEKKGKSEWTDPLGVRLETYRQKVLTQKTVKASGFVILKNTKRKRVQQLSNWWNNVTYALALWGKSIRTIEGVHGSGVASYFLFLRWLFGLNIVLFTFMFCLTTIPMALHDTDSLTASTDTAINTSYYCSLQYTVEKGSGVTAALEFIQGTGWMEKTLLFYGYYAHALKATYNLPLGYVLTVLACLIISLILMARYTGRSFREALLNAANTNFEYSNKVFGAWDYSLIDCHAAEQKQRAVHTDIQSDMLEQTFMRKRIERLQKRCSRCKLYTLRLVINFFILLALGGAAYLIYFVTSWSTEYASEHTDATGTDAWLLLLVQYLPSLAITLCNVILPLLFEKVVILEDYSQAFVIQITLIRTVFLRLASLIVLVISLFSEISCTPKDSCNANTGSDCTEIKCWETYVGQQFYKLAIMDFLVVVIKVFLVELPRRFAAAKCDCGLIKALGPPEFNIPANVLDLVYGQCLIWLGFLFSPLLPGLAIIKLFLFFFVKKLSALVACPPTDRPYKASRINVFFMVILLVAFSLCALPVMYSVFAIKPSKGCGPFLTFNSMQEAITKAVDTWPSALNITYDFLTSAAVTTIVIIFLAVAVYYLRSIGNAHKHQATLYREQLIMEGRDKQFLMSKLQEMYMPGNKAKQEEKEKKEKKKKPDQQQATMMDETRGPNGNNPPHSFSPPNAVDNQGDW